MAANSELITVILAVADHGLPVALLQLNVLVAHHSRLLVVDLLGFVERLCCEKDEHHSQDGAKQDRWQDYVD